MNFENLICLSNYLCMKFQSIWKSSSFSTQISNLRAHTTKHEVGQLWHQAQAFTGTTGKIVAVSRAVALATQLTGNILTTLTFFKLNFLLIFLQIIKMLGQNVLKVMFIELSNNLIFDIGSHNILRTSLWCYYLMNTLRKIFRTLK